MREVRFCDRAIPETPGDELILFRFIAYRDRNGPSEDRNVPRFPRFNSKSPRFNSIEPRSVSKFPRSVPIEPRSVSIKPRFIPKYLRFDPKYHTPPCRSLAQKLNPKRSFGSAAIDQEGREAPSLPRLLFVTDCLFFSTGSQTWQPRSEIPATNGEAPQGLAGTADQYRLLRNYLFGSSSGVWVQMTLVWG